MNITDLVYIDSTGYHFADYPSFLAWRQQQIQDIYGADLYIDPDSQDGQLLAIQALADFDTAALGASVFNSFSPVTAQGVGLSRNVKINGLTRQSPSFSTVVLTLVGTANTVITNGIATDSLQQQWLLPASVTIPSGGTIDVTATAAVVGAVLADPDSITTIFTPTRGWQTVNNAVGATPGAPVETDAALRIRQAQSTANPSLTVFDGTIGAVENVPGVTKVGPYENDTASTDGNGIPSHSICMVVAGGDDTAVAEAIQIHKTPGTGTYGDTAIPLTDSHGVPITIRFQRAVTATIGVQIDLDKGVGWTNDTETDIAAAVAAVINAGGIGDTIFLTKLFAPAYLNGAAAGSTYDITSIELKKNGGSFAAANVDLNFDENPVCDPLTDITINAT